MRRNHFASVQLCLWMVQNMFRRVKNLHANFQKLSVVIRPNTCAQRSGHEVIEFSIQDAIRIRCLDTRP